MTDGGTQQPPTVTGYALKCAIAALRKRDVDIRPLLRRAGLSDQAIGDPRHRMSAAGQIKFFEYAAKSAADRTFGLHLARQANPREAGLLFYVMSAAKNIGEALALLARYFRIVNESVRMNIAHQPKSVVADICLVGIPRHRARQATEFGITLILKALREIAGRDIRPERVAFLHIRTTDLREFERAYGCRVEFGASSDLLELSSETAALPLITQDPYLLETLRPFCDEAARARSTTIGSVRAAVENEVQKLLPHGSAQAETVAKALGVSVRTLSRRLDAEGATFADVVDKLRRSLALEYLKEPGFTSSQIAWLLGYESSTSFNHAFKRWTGRSPSAARAEARLPAPA